MAKGHKDKVAVITGAANGIGQAFAKRLAEDGVHVAVVDLADEKIAALYERSLVLVRPDGHVAWRADDTPADALALIDKVRGAA